MKQKRLRNGAGVEVGEVLVTTTNYSNSGSKRNMVSFYWSHNRGLIGRVEMSVHNGLAYIRKRKGSRYRREAIEILNRAGVSAATIRRILEDGK